MNQGSNPVWLQQNTELFKTTFFCVLCQEEYKYSEVVTVQLPCMHQVCHTCFHSHETTKCSLCRKPFEMQIQIPPFILQKWEKLIQRHIEQEVDKWCEQRAIALRIEQSEMETEEEDDILNTEWILSALEEMQDPLTTRRPIRSRAIPAQPNRRRRRRSTGRRNRHARQHTAPVQQDLPLRLQPEDYRRFFIDDLPTLP